MKTHILLFGFATWMALAAIVAAIFGAWWSVAGFFTSGVLLAWAGIEVGFDSMLSDEVEE